MLLSKLLELFDSLVTYIHIYKKIVRENIEQNICLWIENLIHK